MVTPPKGDTSSVPLNAAGRKVADAWDLAADRTRGDLCKAFGPPSLIRQPTRLRIRWEDDQTLLLEFDAGTQARRLHFTPAAAAARSLQGQSQAKWFRQAQNRGIFGRGGRAAGGSLEVVTTNLRAGYLRPNGVPYSERTVVKDFFDSFTLPDGSRGNNQGVHELRLAWGKVVALEVHCDTAKLEAYCARMNQLGLVEAAAAPITDAEAAQLA